MIRSSNPAILVPKQIADPGDLPPVDVRMALFQLVRDMPARFRDDLDARFDRPPDLPALLEFGERHIEGGALDALDRFKNVVQAQPDRPLHDQKIRSAFATISSRISGCRPSRVVTSASTIKASLM